MSVVPQLPYVVAIYNQKGGIAKTTTAVNLAIGLAAFGKSVLVIDLDPQGNSTKSLLPTGAGGVGIYDVIRGDRPIEGAVIPSAFERVGLLPATYRLAGIELDTASELRSQRTLAEILRNAELPHDIVVIDCAPAFGLLSVNAIVAANAVLIPATASQFAYDGLTKTWQIVETIQNGLNRQLVIHGILLALMDDDPITHEFAVAYRRDFKNLVYRTEIFRDRSAVKAARANLPLSVYNPKSPAARQYFAFVQEFLERQATLNAGREPAPPSPASAEEAELYLERMRALYADQTNAARLDTETDSNAPVGFEQRSTTAMSITGWMPAIGGLILGLVVGLAGGLAATLLPVVRRALTPFW